MSIGCGENLHVDNSFLSKYIDIYGSSKYNITYIDPVIYDDINMHRSEKMEFITVQDRFFKVVDVFNFNFPDQILLLAHAYRQLYKTYTFTKFYLDAKIV